MAEIEGMKDMDPSKDVYEPVPGPGSAMLINRDGLWYDKPISKLLAEMLGIHDDFSGKADDAEEGEIAGEAEDAPEFAAKPSEMSLEEYKGLAIRYLQRKHHCLQGEAMEVVEDNEDSLREWYEGNKTIADNYLVWDIYFIAIQKEAFDEAMFNYARKLKWQIMRGEMPRSEWTDEMAEKYGELPPLPEKQ